MADSRGNDRGAFIPNRFSTSGRASRLEMLGLQEMATSYPRRDNSIFSFDAATIRQDAAGARIIVHARYPALVEAFLAHKRAHGSSVEKRVYGRSAEAWTWRHQVARLVAKRPLAFLTRADLTLLRSGVELPRSACAVEWDRVGTERDLLGGEPDEALRNQYLGLDEYLSYDEMMLGSLLGVSGPSYFINDGARDNRAQRARNPATHERRGVVVGLVGARFERPDRMDSVHCLPPVAAPRQHPELTRLFQDFFFAGAGPGVARNPAAAFDAAAYEARMRVTVDILLLEAHSRAAAVGRMAYLYVVGLGLGVWALNANQPRLYIETFVEALSALDDGGRIDNVSVIEFAYINVPAATRAQVTDAAAQRDINVTFSTRNPAAKLPGNQENMLLVLSYAWDGNSFPGNEYWMGSLAASGDPAAACMSTIGELHNPVINPGLLQRIEVLGAAPGGAGA